MQRQSAVCIGCLLLALSLAGVYNRGQIQERYLTALRAVSGPQNLTQALNGNATRPAGLEPAVAAKPPEPVKVERGEDTVMALAAYNQDVSSFNLMFVNTLRNVGYEGNIFLGVWAGTPDKAHYFRRARVTPKYMNKGPCDFNKSSGGYMLRQTCTVEFPHLKLEVARFAYARRWLEECPSCTGWSLCADYNDVNFQRHPFAGIERIIANITGGHGDGDEVFFTEEMLVRNDAQGKRRGIDTNHWFVNAGVRVCYGSAAAKQIGGKPMLNVGSTIATRSGMLKYLGRLVEEFEKNAAPSNPRRKECDPSAIADQAVLNYLVWSGEMPFGRTMPYGKWVVNTMGLPCTQAPGVKPSHSATDIVIIDENFTVWNEDGTLPAVIHQGKVCFTNYDTKYLRRTLSGSNKLVWKPKDKNGTVGVKEKGAS